MSKRISKHISYMEAVASATASAEGIANKPNEAQLEAMKIVANNVFEPLREYFKVPIKVSSFFRSEELNHAVGGSDRSQHLEGEAMDLDGRYYGGVSNKRLFHFIVANLEFDQVIAEYGDEDTDYLWVHVSFNSDGNNRGEIKRKKVSRPYELLGIKQFT